MTKWQRIVDRLIAESIGDGDVSHLPAAGKRLPLNDESNTPDDMRAAFKIMEDHNVTPDWIEAGKALEQAEAKLRRQLGERARRYLRDLDRAHSDAHSKRRERVQSSWLQYRARFLERVERYNREALTHNLALPKGIAHRQTLRGEQLIERTLQEERSK